MAQKTERVRSIPLHSRIERVLAEEIRSGVWPAGGTLPAEIELAQRFGVSRMTVRQALGSLAEQGLLIRQRGRATRIAVEPIVQSLGRFYAFAYEMERLGREHSSRIVEVGLARPGPIARQTFGLHDGDEVAQITLLRLLGNEPLMVETASFRSDRLALLERPDVTERPLYDLLDEAGLRVTRSTERIRPVVLNASQARLLDAPARSPAFLVQRTSYVLDEALELRESIVRGDRYCFVAELRRDQIATLA
jgi:GntR family transcriptional regulator